MKTHIMVLTVLAGVLGVVPATKALDWGVTVVRPGTTDILTAKVFAGNWAAIGLVGDGDTDLDLYVYDPFGRLVGSDDDATDHCLVRFYARYTGTYTIRVVNRSHRFSNRYEIAID